MEQYDFEEFDKAARAIRTIPTVTIQKRGTIGLSRAAHEELGEPEAVTLHFDSKRQVVGIRAADTEKPNAIPVRQQAASKSYIFSGIAFAHRYGIPLGEARRYRAKRYGGDMIIIDLNQESTDASWPPKKRDEFGRILPLADDDED